MCSDSSDFSVVYEDNLVHLLDSRNSVRDEKGGLSLASASEVVENLFLRVRVDGRYGVVKDKYGSVLYYCSRDGNTLLLTAGNRNSALSENSFVAFGELCYP